MRTMYSLFLVAIFPIAISAMEYDVENKVTEDKQEYYEIVSESGIEISGNINEYLIDNGFEIHANNSNSSREITPSWNSHFRWDYRQRKFMNLSSGCKVFIVRVTSGKGYDKLWYHRSNNTFDMFSHPPYRNSSTWVRKTPIAATDCTDNMSGYIRW